MESVMLDELEREIVSRLRVDGRAPFSRIAAALDVSENTVARRYQKLRSAGLLRVVGSVNGPLIGRTSWTLRIRCTPDAADPIAAALARRPDTFWVHLLAGGTEISCNVQARSDTARDALLMDKLPRTSRVLDVSAHALLGESGPEVALDEGDHALLAALARDGRTRHTELATATGWSESTVKRRIEGLRAAGVLVFEVDLPPAALGLRAEARLWLTVRPSALRRVAAAIAAHPEVVFSAVTTGRTNLTAMVACRDSGALYRYLTDRIGGLDEVHTAETAPVIRTVKRAGPVLPR
ncbi:Lrp/AsnC family transcriptional regulator [Crossiella sp. CA198]|uniref:Lrp/AsnC family transcriptional regulator n=1 Tax=Crossiella sp. CA198 TaxID=3455607 RepID=UPI003F8D4963